MTKTSSDAPHASGQNFNTSKHPSHADICSREADSLRKHNLPDSPDKVGRKPRHNRESGFMTKTDSLWPK